MQMLSYRFINPTTGISRFTAIPLQNITTVTWESGKVINIFTIGTEYPIVLTFDSADKALYVYNKLTENSIQC